MRRALLAALFTAASVGFLVLPAGADPALAVPSSVVLAFDFSDNSTPASASNGPFNIIADVLPEGTGGIVRMVAIPPADSNLNNLICKFQPVQQAQVECAFNFTTNGVWSIKAEYSTDLKSDVSSVSITQLRVAN